MWFAILSAIVIVAFVVLLAALSTTPKAEHFDVYKNHYIGASDVYGLPLDQTELIAKYNWSARDATGQTVYDYYYDDYLREIGNTNNNDPEYGYREVGSLGENNVYDLRFETLPRVRFDQNGDRIPEPVVGSDVNLLSTYRAADIADRAPVWTPEPNGQFLIGLSQKNY
jgi:hypothetical protein